MIKISAVIISFNEERDIEKCLQSVAGLADEILILDSFSTDNTEAICKRFSARFEQHVFDSYGPQKNRAIQMASHDYILSLDADEALSEEAIEEIRQIKENWSHDGYIFNRRNNYCGRWMKHTTWYPDRKLRLFDRKKAACTLLDLHEYIQMDSGGTIRQLKGDLLHWTVRTKEEQEAKTEQFARISAKYYFERGIRSGLGSAAFHCVWRWLREYCINLGFLDGKAGWQVSRFSALYVWKKYYYLRQLYEE